MLPISWLSICPAASSSVVKTALNPRRPPSLSALVAGLGIAAALFFGALDPARAGSDSQNQEETALKSDQAAQQKTDNQTTDKSKPRTEDVKAKDQPKIDTTQSPPWLSLTTTLIDKVLSWMLVALIFIFMFRDRLAALMDGVISALGDRGGDV